MKKLLGYTREPIDNVYYDARLAYSLHLADGAAAFTALNHNSGVLFAKATENADGSLNPKTIKEPVIFKPADGGTDGDFVFAVAALRFGGDGEDDPESAGKAFLFKTADFLEYTDAEEITIDEYNRIKSQNATPAAAPPPSSRLPAESKVLILRI